MASLIAEPIVTMALLILIPLVPTVLLYALFKNFAEFQDVKKGVKLGGAVAFYFVLFVTVYPVFKSVRGDALETKLNAQIEENERTVQYYQSVISDAARDSNQKLVDLKTAFENRLENIKSEYQKRLEQEEARYRTLEARVLALDAIRKSLEGTWKWTAVSAAAETVARVSAEAPAGAPVPRANTSTGAATFQRGTPTGEIVIWGTMDQQVGTFRASEIILDHDRLIYLFEHQPSGMSGVAWLNFQKNGDDVTSMNGHWVLAGREGKGTIAFAREAPQR